VLPAPVPENETDRLAALRAYDILDTNAEQAFDDLTLIASQICQTPVALITLVDEQRQWIKSKVGVDLTETSRESAFCAHTIMDNQVMEVTDATQDERFADNALVADDPNIRFYAGAPLITPEGYALGSLCAVDDKPGQLSDEQREALSALSRQVVSQLELRRSAVERERARHAVLQAKESAESANKAKSDFLANMSHEIRTPLTAIMGYADVLRDGQQSGQQYEEAAKIIRSSSEHLLGIINDVLDLSKIEAGEMAAERIATSPWQIISEVASNIRVRATKKDLAFEVMHNPPLPELVQSDPTRLRQILMNLCDNAVKFTGSGVVRLITGMTEVDDQLGRPRLQFDVIDSGKGMTAEQVDGLFQAFQQGDASTTREYGGTGLGLNISKRLAQMLGGDIKVQSQVGRGTVFTLTVDPGPLDQTTMLDQAPEEADDRALTGDPSKEKTRHRIDGRVLLAEDGHHNRNLLRLFLEQAGARVTEAENGRVAVERHAQAREANQPFDAVLMDMQMPELDGYDATRQIRQAGYEGPIIALTAHAMTGDRERCLRVGCSDYLSKPIKQPDLLKALADHLSSAALTSSQSESAGDPENEQTSAETTEADLQEKTDQPPSGQTLQSTQQDEAVQPFLDRFVADLPRQVAELEQLAQADDRDNLARTVHTLKGTAGTYGFDPIAKQASQLEQTVQQNASLEAVQSQVDSLLRMVRTVSGYDPDREPPARTATHSTANSASD
jgi:signal transduction histidine kinase/DNA-binding response OmpR family regulator